MLNKLILTLFTLILLCGCEQSYQEGIEYEIDVYEVEHNGHTYLIFDNKGIVHNPECSKCLNK